MIGVRAVWDVEEKAKRRGKSLAASAHYRDLILARNTAVELAKNQVPISADDVRAEMARTFPETDWGPWAGNLFSGDGWRPVGVKLSTAPGRRRGLVRTWVRR